MASGAAGRSFFGRRAEESGEPASLAPCPCGDRAVWYRSAPPASESPSRALGSITADQITENLCDGCFLGLIPEEKRGAWTRFDPPAAARSRGEDQSPRYDPFDVRDISPED